MYVPTDEALASRHWFSRKPLTNADNRSHYQFPLIETPDGLRCLCRRCSPADDMRQEEMLQSAYIKCLEREYEAIKRVQATRGFALHATK